MAILISLTMKLHPEQLYIERLKIACCLHVSMQEILPLACSYIELECVTGGERDIVL